MEKEINEILVRLSYLSGRVSQLELKLEHYKNLTNPIAEHAKRLDGLDPALNYKIVSNRE